MKKILLLLFCGSIIIALADTNQYVWHQGRLQYATSVKGIDSVRYELTTAQKVRILLPRKVEIKQGFYEINAQRTQVVSSVNDTITFEEPKTHTQPTHRVSLFLSNQIDF